MALWTPAEIATALWYDHSDLNTQFNATSGGALVLPGGAIARLENKSGNGGHCTQGTSSDRPTLQTNVQNGLAVGRYDGSNDQLFGNAAAEAATNAVPAMYLAIVAQATNFASSSQPRLFQCSTGDNTTNQRVGLSFESSKWRFGCRRLNANSIGVASSPGNADSTWNLACGLADLSLTTSEALRLSINGTEVATSSLPGTSTLTSNTNSARVSIASLSTVNELAGDIGEILLLVSLPSLELRQTIEGYLAHKWGIDSKLPAGHPYRLLAPGEGGAGNTRRRRFALGGYGL